MKLFVHPPREYFICLNYSQADLHVFYSHFISPSQTSGNIFIAYHTTLLIVLKQCTMDFYSSYCIIHGIL